MANIDFPSSPTLNQVFSNEVGSWRWNGYGWAPLRGVSVSGGGNSTYFGDDPPEDPSANPYWFNTIDGLLYIYYDDGSSSQWVALAGPKGDTGSQGAQGAAGETIYIVGEAYIINEAGTSVTLDATNCWPAIIRCTSNTDVTAILQAGQTAYGRYWMLRQAGLGYITIAPTNSASESVTRNGNFKSFTQHTTLSAMIVAENTLDIEGGSSL